MARCALIPTKNGFTVPNHVVAANREHDRRLKAGLICAACGAPFGTAVAAYGGAIAKPDAAMPHCCTFCAADFR
jgi:hypothetical protein